MTASARPVALVTGGGTGVGAAAAVGFAARGCHVAINYASSAAEAEATAEACRAHGVEALVLQGDVAEDADCRRMAEATAERWGRIDALVNNAGVTLFAPLADLAAQNEADFLRIYRVNVLGAYQMARAAAPWLEASGAGAVVNVSSMSAVTGMGSSIPYAASKGALDTLTLSLARALAPKVRVNAVLPGMIATGWFEKGLGADAARATRARAEAGAALGAVCTAEDVAGTVLFLALDAIRMTGQLVQLDAGATLGPPAPKPG
ncbi:MAG: SDR family oxidoreductase [Pseudomonadota bacterium]|nr:SDR family oxidoreductase [Pseudomonadota bacterium]